jgi:hypothetical protein
MITASPRSDDSDRTPGVAAGGRRPGDSPVGAAPASDGLPARIPADSESESRLRRRMTVAAGPGRLAGPYYRRPRPGRPRRRPGPVAGLPPPPGRLGVCRRAAESLPLRRAAAAIIMMIPAVRVSHVDLRAWPARRRDRRPGCQSRRTGPPGRRSHRDSDGDRPAAGAGGPSMTMTVTVTVTVTARPHWQWHRGTVGHHRDHRDRDGPSRWPQAPPAGSRTVSDSELGRRPPAGSRTVSEGGRGHGRGGRGRGPREGPARAEAAAGQRVTD